MRRKCFTLVELLIVIGIIAVLMGILLPTLNAVKRTAQRVVCGTNLSGLGRAMLLYANDYEGDFPRAGGSGSQWRSLGTINDFTSQTGNQWQRPPNADVTITTSLFLLVKWEEVTPSQLVCKGDVGTKEFKFSDLTTTIAGVDDITDFWDFGDGTRGTSWPGQYNSYAYHTPYGDSGNNAILGYALGSYSNPACPLMADRNPYLDKNAKGVYLEGKSGGVCAPSSTEDGPSCTITDGYKDQHKTGNAAPHQREGQNVLFNDTHVKFEKYPNVGITKDNIWNYWLNPADPPSDKCEWELGQNAPYCTKISNDGKGAAAEERDAYLVSERNNRP